MARPKLIVMQLSLLCCIMKYYLVYSHLDPLLHLDIHVWSDLML
jgi:hypothetical protein